MTEAGSFVVAEFETDDILPKSITHEVELSYNFIRYEFETDHHFYWARSYLSEIEKVAIYGPFKSSDDLEKIEAPIDDRVFGYFKRRFRVIERLTENGYEAL